ncbi:hypothetical protein HDV06_004766 [Boothiomyces sp. JEL0866]|nr:hypothetical protein HDV06_004766 [Boothiomyces sp. JEL0866]
MSGFLNKRWLKQELVDELNRVLQEVQIKRTDIDSITSRFSVFEQSGYRAQVPSPYDSDTQETRLIISDKDHAINARIHGDRMVMDILDFDMLSNQKVSVLGHPQDLNYSHEVKQLIASLKEYIVPKPVHFAWGEFTPECLGETVGKLVEVPETITDPLDDQEDEYHDPAMLELLSSLASMENSAMVEGDASLQLTVDDDISDVNVEIEEHASLKEETAFTTNTLQNPKKEEHESHDELLAVDKEHSSKNVDHTETPQITAQQQISNGNTLDNSLDHDEISDSEDIDIDDEIQTQDGSIEEGDAEMTTIDVNNNVDVMNEAGNHPISQKDADLDVFSTQNVNDVEYNDVDLTQRDENELQGHLDEFSTQIPHSKEDSDNDSGMEIEMEIEDDRDLFEKAYDEFEKNADQDSSSEDDQLATQPHHKLYLRDKSESPPSASDEEYKQLFENLANKNEASLVQNSKESANAEDYGEIVKESKKLDNMQFDLSDSDEEFRVVMRRSTGEFELRSSPVKGSDTSVVYRRTSSGRLLKDSEDGLDSPVEEIDFDLDVELERHIDVESSKDSPLKDSNLKGNNKKSEIFAGISDSDQLFSSENYENQSAIEATEGYEISNQVKELPNKATCKQDNDGPNKEPLEIGDNPSNDEMDEISVSSKGEMAVNSKLMHGVAEEQEAQYKKRYQSEHLEDEARSDASSSEGIPITDLADRNENEHKVMTDQLSEELNGNKLQELDNKYTNADLLVLEVAPPILFDSDNLVNFGPSNPKASSDSNSLENVDMKQSHSDSNSESSNKQRVGELSDADGAQEIKHLAKGGDIYSAESDDESDVAAHQKLPIPLVYDDSENEEREKQVIVIDDEDKRDFQNLLGKYFEKEKYDESGDDSVDLTDSERASKSEQLADPNFSRKLSFSYAVESDSDSVLEVKLAEMGKNQLEENKLSISRKRTLDLGFSDHTENTDNLTEIENKAVSFSNTPSQYLKKTNIHLSQIAKLPEEPTQHREEQPVSYNTFGTPKASIQKTLQSSSEVRLTETPSLLRKIRINRTAKSPETNRTPVSTQSTIFNTNTSRVTTEQTLEGNENGILASSKKRKSDDPLSKNARRRTWHPDSSTDSELILQRNPVLQDTVNKLTTFGELLRGKVEERRKSIHK